MSWTPGPWEVRTEPKGIRDNRDPRPYRLTVDVPGETVFRDARLIAKAPEMAELLEEIVEKTRDARRRADAGEWMSDMYDAILHGQARALLAEIKGDS